MPPPVAISKPPRAAPLRPVAAPDRPASAALRLPISLDLPAARPLANSLLERRGQPILIDASAVSQVGAQCAQVLLSAKRTWDADGVSLSMVNCGPRMIEDFALHRHRLHDASDRRIAQMTMTDPDCRRFAHHARHAAARADGRGLSRRAGGRRRARARGARAGNAAASSSPTSTCPSSTASASSRGARATRRFRGVPILVLTTESDPRRRTAPARAGATGWIVKPFDPVKLVDVIRRVAA